MKRIYEGKRFANKKVRIVVILSLIFILLMCVLLSVYYMYVYSDDAVVFTVNGEPATKAEFLNIMLGLRSEVYSEFVSKYGSVDDVRFWHSNINGEIPGEVLKQKALDKLKRIKIEQILFKENGIVSDISYSGFLKGLNAENERRKNALVKNELIYGPEKYSKDAYFDSLHANRIEELISKLSKKELLPDDREINQYYEMNKEELYKKMDNTKFETIKVSYTNDSEGNIPAAGRLIKKIKEDAGKGREFEDLSKSYSGNSGFKMEYKKMELDEKTYKEYSFSIPWILDEIKTLKVGQTSSIIESADAFYIVKITEIVPFGYKTLEEVKDSVVLDIVKKKLEEMIEQRMKETDFNMNWKVYKAIRGE